jgi:hypothetical protein
MALIVTCAAAAFAIFVLGAPAAMASPAAHMVEDVTGDVLVCETTTYTIVSGEIKIAYHEDVSASGNFNVTGTITPQDVIVMDEEGNLYSLRGAGWFGSTGNAQQGTFQATDTAKLQVIAQGSGIVDSVNTTFHITSVNGNLKEFDFGTCEEPEEGM